MPNKSPELPPPEERALEDYVKGALYEFGVILVEQSQVIAFASQFDPQDMHMDAAKASEGTFGGLVASGWHTAAMTMRLLADNFLPLKASLGSPGIDNLRWLAPVRPRNRLRIRVKILEARRLRSKPDRGIVKTFTETMNEDGVVVLSLQANTLVMTRAALRSRLAS